MHIFLNDQIDPTMWNHFAGEHVFHRYEWLKVMKTAYEMKPFFVLATDETSFALYPSFIKSKCCVSLPFINIAGYLSNSAVLQQSLSNFIHERGYRDVYRTLAPIQATAARITGIVDISDRKSYL